MKPQSERFSVDFMMGGMAAIVSKSGAAPIERVKLLLQNQGELLKRGQLKRPYTGISDCVGRILREEGVVFLERSPGKCHTLFSNSGYFKSLFGCSKEKDGYLKWFAGNIASGSAAGATTSLFMYHLDYACTRLGTDSKWCPVSGQHQYKGLVDVYRQTWASDGIKGLYRGFRVSIVGITLYRGLYFGLHDTLKPVILVGHLQDNLFASFFLGWSITTVSGVCAYPFDTVRRRMMLTFGQPIKYRNPLHAFREIVRLEGFNALFHGVSANMLLGVAGAGALAGYDQLARIVTDKVSVLSHKEFKVEFRFLPNVDFSRNH